MADNQPLRTITRACGMILAEAGLTTFQADQIRKHVQDILAAAAEQERALVSSRSLSNSSKPARRGPLGTPSDDRAKDGGPPGVILDGPSSPRWDRVAHLSSPEVFRAFSGDEDAHKTEDTAL
jgi:hypothetical protein